jgi:hypothetical protein
MRLPALLSTTLVALAATAAAHAAPLGPVADINITVGPELTKATEKFDQRDLDFLKAELRESVERELAKSGGEAGGRLDLVIEDAKPNRPTMRQMSRTPGLSFESRSIGGADITGTYTSADGVSTPVSYSWYESDLRNVRAASTWSDAEATFDRFARRLAKGEQLAQK